MTNRFPQQAEVVRVGRHEYRRRSDARIAAQNAELLTKLLNAAFGVLQHDADLAGVPERYEWDVLRKKFARILKLKIEH